MNNLYIDPGTGSMLFAILIGVFGALGFIIRNAIVKIKFALSRGKGKQENNEKIPFVIFSDDKRYWKTFDPVCRQFDKRGIDVVYMTESPDDPALDNPYPHIHGEFIGEGNKGFFRLNFLNANIVLATTPGLDVYQWKRSKDVDYYVHIAHAPNDITLYHMFGLDYYDAVLLSGDYQVEQVRKLEKLRDLQPKELTVVGLPYMDDMSERLNSEFIQYNCVQTVLLAPSWGESAILSRFGSTIIRELLNTGYNIIVRPHPQSVVSEKEMLYKLMEEFPDSERIQWNFDNDNYNVLKNSDILISDFSGVLFEFSLVYDKPVIFTRPDTDWAQYDQWWLDDELWTFKVLPTLGEELTADSLNNLREIIDNCINNPKYARSRQIARDETWAHYGRGAELAVDYLVNKYNELAKKED
ncbi:MAG: CDP-glycerol glycerophosphotransferase family protein [Clostridia bacterium]|nr:CDP-glycerol glycerophosphotransferase family protein [Clostridia bacterium]